MKLRIKSAFGIQESKTNKQTNTNQNDKKAVGLERRKMNFDVVSPIEVRPSFGL